jgi:hypothetical protein
MRVPNIAVLFRTSGQDGQAGGDASFQPDRTFWRYYFAGQALAGFCAAAAPDYTKGACADAITERAARQAELLLAELERREDSEGADHA